MHTSAHPTGRSLSQSSIKLLRLMVAGSAFLALAASGLSQTAGQSEPVEKKEDAQGSAETPQPAPGAIPASAPVAPDIIELEALKVNSGTVKNSMVTDRKNSNVSVDLLTTQDFGKFVSTDIADLVIRIPGLSTTSQGSFAVVRGLSERYNPVMLDGIVLPSSDPERQSPELDIFPTRLVDAIVISKTYEASLPGTSSGAGIDLRTKPLPEGRFAQVQFGLRADEGVFKNDEFLGSSSGGRWDYLGLGAKDRHSNPLLNAQGASLAGNVQDYLRAPTTVNQTKEEHFPIGGRLGLTYENRIPLSTDSDRALGYVVSFGYDRSASSESGTKLKIAQNPTITINPSTGQREIIFRPDINTTEYRMSTYLESQLESRLGLLASVGLAFNPENQVSLNFFWSQIGLDGNAREKNDVGVLATYGQIEKIRSTLASDPQSITNDGSVFLFGPLGSEEIYYRQRRLYDLNLKGEHEAANFGSLRDAKVSWTAARINVEQEEPEYLISPYGYDYSSPRHQIDFGGALSELDRYYRFWRDTDENSWAGRIDVEFKLDVGPLDGAIVKLGGYTEHTRRSFTEGSFTFLTGALVGQSYADAISGLPALTNIAPQQSLAKADRRSEAHYSTVVLPLVGGKKWIDKLDLVAGVRTESFRMRSTGSGAIGNEKSGSFYLNYYNELGQTQKYQDLLTELGQAAGNLSFEGLIDEKKSLPAYGLNYSPLKSLTLRLAYSKTMARPSFREVGSYFTDDRVADELVHGNKDLKTSEVRNYDLRVEYFFPRSKDLAAFSVFKKKITNPIERISVRYPNLGFVSSFVNNPNDALVKGYEFEVAKKLGFLGATGEMFVLGGNVTRIDAEVDRDTVFEEFGMLSTVLSKKRRLYDQPESIANAYVTFDYRPADFSATLSYFKISDVLQKINKQLPDTYVAGYSRWDLALSKRFGSFWQVRLSARNLEDSERKLIYDPESSPVEIALRTYRDGRSYTLTAVYEF